MARPRSPTPLLGLLAAGTVLLGLAACDSWPFRGPPTNPDNVPPITGSKATPQQQIECQRLEDQIRDSQQLARNRAATSTTSPVILQATQAKADLNTQDLRDTYASLGCASIQGPAPATVPRAPLLPPAPNGGR